MELIYVSKYLLHFKLLHLDYKQDRFFWKRLSTLKRRSVKRKSGVYAKLIPLVFFLSLLSSVNKRHDRIKANNVFNCCSALSLTPTVAPGTESLE